VIVKTLTLTIVLPKIFIEFSINQKCILFVMKKVTVFNINNNKKYFLSTKSAFFNEFCRIM